MTRNEAQWEPRRSQWELTAPELEEAQRRGEMKGGREERIASPPPVISFPETQEQLLVFLSVSFGLKMGFNSVDNRERLNLRAHWPASRLSVVQLNRFLFNFTG